MFTMIVRNSHLSCNTKKNITLCSSNTNLSVDPPAARSNDDYYDYEEPKEYEDPKEYDESKNYEEYKKPEDYEDYPDPKNYEDTNYEDQHEPEDSEYQADG